MICYGCGSNSHAHGHQSCPAINKKCNYCGISNHFETMCNIKKNSLPGTLNSLNISESEDQGDVCSVYKQDHDEENEYLFALNDQNLHDITVNVDNQPVTFLIDSGARRVNILDRSSLRAIKEKTKIELHPTNSKIYPYGCDQPLSLDGVVYCNLEYQGTHSLARIHISSKEKSGNILIGM